MFLYEKKKDNIDVFLLSRNQERIREYRMEQMKKIPFDKSCLYTEEVVASYDEQPFLADADLTKIIIHESDLVGKEKSVNYNTDSDDCIDLLDRYYADKYIDRPVARVQFLRELRYWLMASNVINVRKKDGKIIKSIHDIIEIPKSLYLLQLFEQERFAMLANEDISEQLQLFSFSHLNNFSLAELKKMDEAGVTNGAYSNVISKAANDQPILQLLNK